MKVSLADDAVRVFESARPRLWSVAYRMLGSISDADDAVQDTYLKWYETDPGSIENSTAWLLRVCTHRCLDMLKAAHRSRVDYVGAWLPEPVVSAACESERDQNEFASSLTTAFLLLLERLTPLERAVYLLREVFDYSYSDTASIVNMSEPACRKVVSRVKKRLPEQQLRTRVPRAQQEKLLGAFLKALSSADTTQLECLLAEDVEFWGDGGGKAPAVQQIVRCQGKVAQLLESIWVNVWHKFSFKPTTINGQPGALICDEHRVVGTLSLDSDTGNRCQAIYVVRNPDKLKHISFPE